MNKSFVTLTIAALAASAAMPAAAKDAPVQLQKCAQSLGTIAVVEGDTQGWSDYGLGSPRELINTLALESGCFTPHNAAGGQPADFLMNVVAGDSEEVDQSVNLAKSAVTEGLVRSGVAGSVLSRVPVGGALLGAFGGLGGKKKTLAAGIKLLSPASGMAIATGSGTVKKSSLTFGGANAWSAGANASGYGKSKDGKQERRKEIVKKAHDVAEHALIASVPKAAAPAAAAAGASVAIDTILRAGPSGDATEVRTLRAGTELKPTGQRDGLFIEVEDNYGTKGWVSVEDLA